MAENSQQGKKPFTGAIPHRGSNMQQTKSAQNQPVVSQTGPSASSGTPSSGSQPPANGFSQNPQAPHGSGRGGGPQVRGSWRGGRSVRGGRGGGSQPIPPVQSVSTPAPPTGTGSTPSGNPNAGTPQGLHRGSGRGSGHGARGGQGRGGSRGGVTKNSRTKSTYPYAQPKVLQQLRDSVPQVNAWTGAASSAMQNIDTSIPPPVQSSVIPQSALTSTSENVAKQHKQAAVEARQTEVLFRFRELKPFTVWHRKPPTDRSPIIRQHIKQCGELLAPHGLPKSDCLDLRGTPRTTKRSVDMVSVNDPDVVPKLELWFCEPLRAAQIMLRREPGTSVLIVNDAASAKEACAGFEAGVSTDYEERLLSKTTLFPILKSHASSFPLTWDEDIHQVIYSTNVLVLRSHAESALPEDEKFHVDVLTCPADNLLESESVPESTGSTKERKRTEEVFHLGPAVRYGVSQATAKARYIEKLKSVLREASLRAMTTVVLPPYGCGKGHPIKEVASIIRDVVLSRGEHSDLFDTIGRVIVAVSKDVKDQDCWSQFEEVFTETVHDDIGQKCTISVDSLISESLRTNVTIMDRRAWPQLPAMDEMED